MDILSSDKTNNSGLNWLRSDRIHSAYLFQKVLLYNAVFQYKKEIGRFPDSDDKKVLRELLKDNSLHKQFVDQPDMLMLNSNGQAIGEDGNPITYKFLKNEISVSSDGTAIVGPASNNPDYRIVQLGK